MTTLRAGIAGLFLTISPALIISKEVQAKSGPSDAQKLQQICALGRNDARIARICHASVEGPRSPRIRPIAPEDPVVARFNSTPPKPPLVDNCGVPRFFVRADPLDDVNYAVVGKGTKKGASFSFTDNYRQAQSSLTASGRISLLVFGDPCATAENTHDEPYLQGFALAPFTSFNGTINSPRKVGELSSVKGGVDAQIAYHFPGSASIYLSGSPYYQTDFRGLASAAGGSVALTPVFGPIGESIPIPSLASYVTLLGRGEVDYLHVDRVGLSDLRQGERPVAGVAGRLVFDLFRSVWSKDIPSVFADKLSVFVSGQYFYNLRSSTALPYYSAALSYALFTGGAGPGTGGALALEYDRGTDKDTEVKVDQLLLKLTFAY